MENNSLEKKGIASYGLVILFVLASFFIVLATKGIFALILPSSPSASFEGVASSWESRIVKVECDGEQSTGFIAESKIEDGDNYLYIITSAHGVDQNPTSAIFTIGGEEYESENLSVNSNIDVAVFKVQRAGRYSLPNICAPAIAKQVMALGYESNEDVTAQIGFINKEVFVDEHSSLSSLLCYDISAFVNGGMSGCPILSIDGEFLGIGVRTKVTTQNGQQVTYSADNYVVPAPIIFAEYDRAVDHNSKSASEYTVEMENGTIIVNVDNIQAVYQNGQVTINNKKVEKVANKTIKNIVDFVEQISYYSNRNAMGELKIQLSDEEILVKVVNE